MTSYGDNTTDKGLPEIDAMFGQNSSVAKVGPCRFPVENVSVDTIPRGCWCKCGEENIFLGLRSITPASLQRPC